VPKPRASQIQPALETDGITPALPSVGDAVTAVDTGAGASGLPALDGAFVSVAKLCSKDKTIPSGSAVIGADHTIADGVQVTIEDDGDWLIL
jgi:hypothetical protein